MTFEKIESLIQNNEFSELEHLLKNEIPFLFDTPNLKKIYEIIKPISFTDHNIILSVCWLALLSGDNLGVYSKALMIDPLKLEQKSLSFYYDLQALSGLFGDKEKRLEYSLLAIESLEETDTSFYKANAYLTHGQILVGFQRLREAADTFLKSHQLFLQNNMMFAASVALTNALLNWFRLAEFDKVVTHGERALLMSSSFHGSSHDYWEVISLPLGMCYVEQNKNALAKEYLLRAYKCIQNMELVHMHGYIEIYLMKNYFLLNDNKAISNMIIEAEKTFEMMHYPMMQIIIFYGKMLVNQLSQSDIERIEAVFEQNQVHHPLLIEILGNLYNTNLSFKMTISDIEKYINQARFEGDHVNLQILLLILAERYYKENDIKSATLLLEEVITMYDKLKLQASIHLYDFTCFPLIQKIDKNIKPKTNHQELLTSKELEIVKLISQGKSNDEVGSILFISVGTVKWHMNHILSKLEAKNRIQAVEKAKILHLI